MAMEEKDIYEALGMAMPKKPDDTAPPEPEEHLETVEQQEPEGVEEPPALPETTVQEPTQEPAQVDVEAQHRAELERVRAEAREQAMAEANAQFAEREKNFFARAGLKDQYRENAAIGSFAEFDQWYDKNQQQRMEQQLRSGKLTPEILQQAANQAANQAVAQRQEQQQQAQQQRDAQFQEAVRSQLEQIRQMDPAMVDLPTIMKSQYAEDFRQAVTDGANFLSAFRTAKRLADAKNQAEAKVRAAAATAAKQQGKQHLQAHGGSGAVSQEVEVPVDILRIYQEMMPDMSVADIKKDYNKRIKQRKGV